MNEIQIGYKLGAEEERKLIIEKIEELQQFLECDLYTRFNSKILIKNKTLYREDAFKNEKEFIKYIQAHFDILKESILHDNHAVNTQSTEGEIKD